MEDAKAMVAGEDRKPAPLREPSKSSKEIDAMSGGSFEKVEEDVVMVTEADYDMAEQVATQHKNEEDTASLELAGQNTKEFTFLTEASHVDVQKSLADLEDALAKLTTKDAGATKVIEETGTRTGLAQGSQGEGSDSKETFVAFERAPAGSYKITNTETERPLVPGHIRSKLRNFTIGELKDLVSIFNSYKEATSLSEATFHRILEVYALQVMKLQHVQILEADRVKKRDTSVLHKLDPGAEISETVCSACKSPWINEQAEGKCMGCGQQASSVPALEATGLQLKVDGVTWNLKAGAKGSVWLPQEGQQISWEQAWSQKPRPTRGTLWQHSRRPGRPQNPHTQMPFLPTNDSPWARRRRPMTWSTSSLKDATWGTDLRSFQALFFHPQAAKALRLQVKLREAPVREKEIADQKMAKEEASLQAVAAYAGGSACSPRCWGQGSLDMDKFEGYLKRKFEGEEGSRDKWQQIAMAQTSIEQVKGANRKFQEERRNWTLALKHFSADLDSLWTPWVQEILRSTSLCSLRGEAGLSPGGGHESCPICLLGDVWF